MTADFAAVALKGLIEHEQADAYFGSTMALKQHMKDAEARGWISIVASSRSPEAFHNNAFLKVLSDGKAEINLWRVTDKGRAHYKASGLSRFPSQYGNRATYWDWSRYQWCTTPIALGQDVTIRVSDAFLRKKDLSKTKNVLKVGGVHRVVGVWQVAGETYLRVYSGRFNGWINAMETVEGWSGRRRNETRKD